MATWVECSPKICSIPINEVASLSILWDVVTPTEHGSQHGILISPQRGQASGEVRAPNVQRDDLWKLQIGMEIKSGQTETHKKQTHYLKSRMVIYYINGAYVVDDDV